MRTAAAILKSKLRSVDGSHVTETILDYFNLLLGNDQKSINYWNTELKAQVSTKFKSPNNSIFSELRKNVLISKLFEGITEKLGIRWKDDLVFKMDTLSYNVEEIAGLGEKIQFNKPDLLKVYPVTCTMKAAAYSKSVAVLGIFDIF
jgi:hypothetical protein